MSALCSWEDAVRWLREQPDQQELVRLCYYDDPLEDAARRFYKSSEWQATVALLAGAPTGEVLDLGAGRGIASYAFARCGRRVTALEPDSSPLVGNRAISKLAADTGFAIEPLAAFGENLPIEDGRFAIVYGRAVLHHAHNLAALCKEVTRVLKPGGLFLAVREHVISRSEDLPEFLAGHALHKLYGGENAFRLDEYLAAIRGGGMQVRKIIGPYDNPVNYWPQTTEQIQQAVLMRLPGVARYPARRALAIPALWKCVAALLSAWSKAPGRHYAFVGVKK